jgi:hypothetical protein
MKSLERLWHGGLAQLAAPGLDPQGTDPEGYGRAEERYTVNPQLAVIESYALDVIGELTEEEEEEAENAVVGLYGTCRDWRQRVRHELGWNLLMDAVIAENWHRFRSATKAEGSDPEPAEFARRFADEVVRLSRT